MSESTLITIMLLLLVGFFLLLPDKYDPAVRLKQWLERRR
jgi:hypothetical protein